MRNPLSLFDTLSGRKKIFRPLRPPVVTMFVCGPTVQSRMHLGHARTYIFYDALARYLGYLGYDVTFLMNITDIDETITKAAHKENAEPLDFASRMSILFLEDLKHLKVLTVSRFEPVSNRIDEMVTQIQSLLEKGYAYGAGGWVYFDTARFRRWGRLSHQSKRDLSLRPLELSPAKKNLTDFGLWRPEELVKGQWPSPFGLGSPGWHIQDTAVTLPILGPQYDIHGGAYELIYPHHEAEIAQAESLTGVRPLVKYWVHTGLLNMKGHKMSKSRGNVVNVGDALRAYSPDELRFYFLSTHYRKEMDLSALGGARRRLNEMRGAARRLARSDESGEQLLGPFERALNDDFDSPGAIAWAAQTLRSAAKEGDPSRSSELAWAAVRAMSILGVDLLGDS
ncbi:MAG TPA: class I tRNA ligase family protein [Nitrososphaerales archaeon]|nr:class I tRNA ligase family protein [Nitrososphaerales archaeon]